LFSGCPGSGAGSGSTSPGSSGSGSTCPIRVYKSIEIDIVLLTAQNYLWIYNTQKQLKDEKSRLKHHFDYLMDSLIG
jgi:hypothetical protein